MSVKSSEKNSRNLATRGMFTYSRPWTNSPFPHMRDKKKANLAFQIRDCDTASVEEDLYFRSSPNAKNLSLIEPEILSMS